MNGRIGSARTLLAAAALIVAPAAFDPSSNHAGPAAVLREDGAAAGGHADASYGARLDELLDALRAVETGGEPDGGRHAVGDAGTAFGPYQIQRAYWQDAGVPGSFESCRDPAYARRVVIAYWRRWCPDALRAGDLETLARTHNGGPAGPRKAATSAYWEKVRRELRHAVEASEP